MKRLIVAFALIATPLSAAANPELASEWGQHAAGLHAQTTDLITAIDTGMEPGLDLQYLLDVQRFASTANRLGTWIDTSDGARDLGCIFRGMAAEGELQLGTLDTGSDSETMRAALRRLATMFADAELIAIASTRRTALPVQAGAAHAQTCPASAEAALSVLH